MAIAPQLPQSVGRSTIATQSSSNRSIRHNMAQSAVDSRKTPLHIDAFWVKPTITPPLSWGKWTPQSKLALLAKEGIELQTLLNEPLSTVTYPTELVYEEPVENNTQATERDRKIRNQQPKVK